jgi:hypothetical protein
MFRRISEQLVAQYPDGVEGGRGVSGFTLSAKGADRGGGCCLFAGPVSGNDV